jgi:hypothetical protein
VLKINCFLLQLEALSFTLKKCKMLKAKYFLRGDDNSIKGQLHPHGCTISENSTRISGVWLNKEAISRMKKHNKCT